MCLPLGKRRVCAGARGSLVQWQDYRSGGRGLRSAARGGTCVGVRCVVSPSQCGPGRHVRGRE
eukprot:6204486-Prymnesium_polylepis.1